MNTLDKEDNGWGEVTMRDVAREAGVSLATVSMALRGDRRVKGATAARVKEVAERLGYRRSAVLSALAVRRFRRPAGRRDLQIAILTTDNVRLSQTEWGRCLERQARARGYGVQWVEGQRAGESGESLARRLRRAGVCGLVLYRVKLGGAWADFPWGEFSVVACNLYQQTAGFETVRVDHLRDTAELIERAAAAGCRRVGVVLGRHEPEVVYDDSLRLAGVHRGQAGLPEAERVVPYTGGFGDGPAFRAWWAETKPDGVVGFVQLVRQHRVSLAGVKWAAAYDLEVGGVGRGLQSDHERLGLELVGRLDHAIFEGRRPVAGRDGPVTLVPSRWGDKVPSPQSPVPSPESPVPSPEFRVPSSEFRVEGAV